MCAAKDIINPDHPSTICATCAWRLECKKKYSFEQGGSVKCADYSRDVTQKTGKTDKS